MYMGFRIPSVYYTYLYTKKWEYKNYALLFHNSSCDNEEVITINCAILPANSVI